MKKKAVTPGTYPTLYQCVLCGTSVKEKEVMVTKAIKLEDTTCVCEPCLPQWEKKQHKPLRDFITKPETRESFIRQCLKHSRERKLKRRREISLSESQDALVLFINASRDDPSMRARLLAIAGLNTFQRESLVNTIISELELKKAPEELLVVLRYLKKDDVASRTIQLLGGNL